MPATAILASGLLGAGSSIIGGGKGASAATQAAKVQAQAAQQAAALQAAEFGIVQGNLQPFIGLGTGAIPALQGLTGTGQGGNPLTAPLTAPLPQWNPTMEGLAQTPGYQFTLQQGLQATQNALAAQGLGRSGAATRGAAQYATGLASQTYNQQLQNYLALQQQEMAYRGQVAGLLGSQVGVGANAAAGQGQIGQQFSSNIANTLTSGAAAQAGGIVGAANATINALGGVSGAGSNTAILMALNQAGLFGPTAAGAGSGAFNMQSPAFANYLLNAPPTG